MDLCVHSSVAPIEEQWHELAEATGASVFLWPGWVHAWLEAYGGDPRIHTVWRAGQLVGVLPLVADGERLESAANWNSPRSGPVALDAEAAAALARLAVDERPARLSLRHVCVDDPATSWYLSALRESGLLAHPTREEVRSPYTALGESWEEHESRLGKNRRKSLRRLDRRLAEQGEVVVDVHDGSDRLDELLEEGFAVEGSGWKGREGTAINSDPATRTLLGTLCRWAAEHGALRLMFLRVDGQAIAFDLLLVHQGVVYALKAGYDEAYRTFAPSIITMREIIKLGIAEGAHTVEWLGDADADTYKLEWSEGSHVINTQVFAPPTLVGRVELHARGAWRWGRERAERARSSAAVRRVATAGDGVRDRLGGLRTRRR